jgi:hypothetical protein
MVLARRFVYLVGFAWALSVLAPSAAAAQPSSSSGAGLAATATAIVPPVLVRDGAGGAVIRATRILAPLVIDGRLDDEVYREVEPITEFLQQEPRSGAPITERTEMWLMFDDENLYVACRCSDEHPERIVSNEMRRDNVNQRSHDNVGVMLDTFHDRRNGFLFSITPVGGFTDATFANEGSFNPNWNTVWENKTSRFEGGWIAEMAIPFKSLRYGPGREQTWGINLRRTIRSKNEVSYLMPMDPAWGTAQAFLRASAGGTLVGLEVPPAAKNIEVKPYAISSLNTDRVGRPSLDNEVDGDIGFDAKLAVTKSVTADFTYNTDFAQVEDDEAQVNLTRFALSFPEKREFFLEGQGVFTVGGSGGDAPALFYSRRIGLAGNRSVPIVGGGRVTGKVGAWSIGALSIEADDDEAAGAAQTNFTVLRLRRDVLRRSTIGALFTNRSVSLQAPGATNQMLALDGNFALFQNVTLAGYLARSRTPGLEGRDYSYRTQFTYAGDRYGLALDRLAVEDNFNPEIGFVRREDFRATSGSARFSPRPRARQTIRQYHFETAIDYVTDTQNRLESRELSEGFRVDLQNGDQISAAYLRSFESLVAPFRIADGVFIPVGGHTFDTARLTYTPGPQHRVSGTYALEVGSFYTGKKTTVTARGRLEASSRLTFEPNVSLNWVDLPEGAFTNTVVGTRGTYTMSPRAFVAALVQYSSSTTAVLTNVRLRWEYHPGSELFIVYSEGRDTFASRTPLETRGRAIKVTRLFRF